MSKTVRALVVAGIAVLAVSALVAWLRPSPNSGAVERFKAQLRAEGEKLAFEEWGFPRAPDPNDGFGKLQAGLAEIGPAFPAGPRVIAGVELMRFVAPGRVEVGATAKAPHLSGSNSVTWEQFNAELQGRTEGLQKIREAVEDPPHYFYFNPTNWPNQSRAPFVQMRTAAQWLAADAIGAVQSQQLLRARLDVHALTRLAQAYRDDVTLVSQMIRIAVAGLGLNATWEVLQADGWTELDLAALQSDWEALDAMGAVERGCLAERAFVGPGISWMRNASAKERRSLSGTRPNGQWWANYLNEYFATALWRANPEADELFALQVHQKSLDSLRRLIQGTPWIEVKSNLDLLNKDLDAKAGSSPLARTRYLFSLRSIPNYSRAIGVAVRNDTQRRLTITVIALKRYRLGHDRWPADLGALVPQFLSAVPIDLMSSKPLHYRLNADGSFVLYSVGEDGRDDDGDPSPASVTNRFDLWSGKDAVWPAAVTVPVAPGE